MKGLFAQELCDPRRNDIRLLGVVLHLKALRALLVVALDTLLGFVDGDVALDMLLGSIQQVFRCFQPVNSLQTDGGLPRFTFLNFIRLALSDILF